LQVGPAGNPLLNTPFANNFRAGGAFIPAEASSSFFTPSVPFRNGFSLGGLGFNGFGFPGFGAGGLSPRAGRLLTPGLGPSSFGFLGQGLALGIGTIPGIGLSSGVGFENAAGVNNGFGPAFNVGNNFGLGGGPLTLTQGVRFDNALGLNPGLGLVTGLGGFGTSSIAINNPFALSGSANGFNSLGMAI
jgi:hypothetical protein